MPDVIDYRFKFRRGLAASWVTQNPVLLDGEAGIERDTRRGKIGDGVTAWNDLEYSLFGDIDLTGLADGMVITWDASAGRWKVSTPAGGGGSGPVPVSITASEALSAGDIVNIWNDAGTAKVRKADATAQGKEAHGFVLASVASAAAVPVYFSGANTALAGLTPGAVLYLSTTPGQAASAWVTATGNVHQEVGVAYSSGAMSFAKQIPITLA